MPAPPANVRVKPVQQTRLGAVALAIPLGSESAATVNVCWFRFLTRIWHCRHRDCRFPLALSPPSNQGHTPLRFPLAAHLAPPPPLCLLHLVVAEVGLAPHAVVPAVRLLVDVALTHTHTHTHTHTPARTHTRTHTGDSCPGRPGWASSGQPGRADSG